MTLDNIKERLGEDWKKVEMHIGRSLASGIGLLDDLNSSVLSHSGKQLRPLISLLAAGACSGGILSEDTFRYAAASELLHNATLFHDDVADSSDQRRGIPTIRSIMGPSVSVLVGDYWLVKAMNLILEGEVGSSRVIKIFAGTLSDLAEGEMLQLEKAASCDTTEEDYRKIIYSKTASLFVASAVSAAISVNASEEMVRSLEVYAASLGMAFQIRDDIFDYSGTAAVGKPLGVDVLEQKITLPLLGALSNVSDSRSAEIRKMVREIRDCPSCRDTIISFVKENGGVEYASRQLKSHIIAAVNALRTLPDSWYRQQLEHIAGYVGLRNC